MHDLIKLQTLTDTLRHRLMGEAKGDAAKHPGEVMVFGQWRKVEGAAPAASSVSSSEDKKHAINVATYGEKRATKMKKSADAKKADVESKDMKTLSSEAVDRVGDWGGGKHAYDVAKKLKAGAAVSDKELGRAVSEAHSASRRASEAESNSNTPEKAAKLTAEKQRAWAAYTALDKVQMKRAAEK